MAGFPGETDAEFEETRRLIEELPLTYLHVFTYSARPGTPAAAMGKQVPVHVARERNRILRDLASEKKLAFMSGFIGKRIETITLNVSGADQQGEYTEGLTDNYLPMRVSGSHAANRWIQTRVEASIRRRPAGNRQLGLHRLAGIGSRIQATVIGLASFLGDQPARNLVVLALGQDVTRDELVRSVVRTPRDDCCSHPGRSHPAK